jgi:hypothetical protein
MTSRIKKMIAASAAALCAAGAIVVGSAGSSAAQPPTLRAFGITDDGKRMATFTTDRPDVLDWVRLIKGLVGDTSLVGIDFRVQDGLMYGVGDQGGVYTIKTPPQTIDVEVTKVSQLQVALYGTEFGVDFNPAADRLRVISDNGQNLRHDLNTHTTVEDAVLTTPPSQSPTKGVTAAAYTNNDLNAATNTTLFDIATVADQVVIQSPANDGKLVATGALGIDAGLDAGFDIFSQLSNGKTVSVSGFASLTPFGGTPTLYHINLFTGETTPVDLFPLNITDIAISLNNTY